MRDIVPHTVYSCYAMTQRDDFNNSDYAVERVKNDLAEYLKDNFMIVETEPLKSWDGQKLIRYTASIDLPKITSKAEDLAIESEAFTRANYGKLTVDYKKLQQRVEEYNTLPWYKRLFRRLEC